MDIRKLTAEERKRIFDAWDKPLSPPKAVPKSEPKKRGRKPKEEDTSQD